jgi:hypothetical protein
VEHGRSLLGRTDSLLRSPTPMGESVINILNDSNDIEGIECLEK